MTRGQANILAGATVGAFFFTALGVYFGYAGQLSLVVRTERDGSSSKKTWFSEEPPDLLAIVVLGLGGTVLGLIGGSVFIIVIGALFGRRLESYLVDVLGALGCGFVCLFVPLILIIEHDKDNTSAMSALAFFGVIVALAIGMLNGWLVGAGLRHLIVGNRS